jgi:hypothetical protein
LKIYSPQEYHVIRDFVFRYNITLTAESVTITQAEQSFEGGAEVLVQLWQRMLGKKDF